MIKMKFWKNENNFYETLTSKSLFDDEKIIIIKRATDKLLTLIEKIDYKKLESVNIIINSDNLKKIETKIKI